MHKIHPTQNENGTLTDGYMVGTVIEILGTDVFNNTEWVPEK